MGRRCRVAFAAPLLLLGACIARPVAAPGEPGEEAGRHRGALATLTVDNATPRQLRIAFRPAPGPGSEVTLGEVPPGSTATVAPLPADEPVILIAVAQDSARFVLPPRSFDLGEHWTWRIPADAAFVAPAQPTPAAGSPP